MYQLIIRTIKGSAIGVLLLATLWQQVAAQCNPDIPLTRPNHRYEAVPGTNGEEVLDKSTGLIWQRCPMGMNWDGKTCAGKPNVYTWLGALQVARSAKFNINTPYFGRWRLPYNQELLTLVDRTCFEPAINRLWFPATPPTWFWSSTPGAGLAMDAYYVDFYDGEGFNGFKDEKAYVRLSRNAER